MSNPEIDAMFRSMVDGIGIDGDPGGLEPADTAVQAILDHFLNRLHQYGPVNLNDPNDFHRALNYLASSMNHFIQRTEALTFEDRIIVKGGTIVTLIGEDEDAPAEALWLSEDTHISGTVAGTYVGHIPDESEFFDVTNRSEDEAFMEAAIPFGITLMLDDSLLHDSTGEFESFPQSLTVCIPLNYQSLQIMKVL